MSLPLPLLTNAIFARLYNLSLLRTLDLYGVVRPSQIALDCNSPEPVQTRTVELDVHKLVSGQHWDQFSLIEQVVGFLCSFQQVSIGLLDLKFHSPSTPTFLTNTPLPNLSHLLITSPPTAFRSAMDYVERVLATQGDLRILVVGVDAGAEGFDLGDDTFVATWIDGISWLPGTQLIETWSGVRVRYVETRFQTQLVLGGDEVGPSLFAFAVEFVPETVVTPVLLESLAYEISEASVITFGPNDLRWENWVCLSSLPFRFFKLS